MGQKSKNKGAIFELKVAKLLAAAYGVELRRTPMSGGWAQGYDDAAGDIVCVKGLFPYCVECKKQEGWRLESLFTGDHAWFDAWWSQMIDECPDDKDPLLIFSRNFMPIFVASTLELMDGCPDPKMFLTWNDNIIVVTLLENFLTWEVYDDKESSRYHNN